MARCAVCFGTFQNGDKTLFRDIYIVHRACVNGPIAKESELRDARSQIAAMENQVAQANKNARASVDHAQQIEARVFRDNAAVHARVSDLEAELARERSRRAAAEATLELVRLSPQAPAKEEISAPEEDASKIRFGLLELE